MPLRSVAAITLCVAVAACSRSQPPSSRSSAPSGARSGPGTMVGAAVASEQAVPLSGASLAVSGAGTGSVRAPDTEPVPLFASSADGVRIAYRLYGHGDPAIVLIHGWACDSSYWRAQIADLASRYTTVALDLAGHGESGRNRANWSMASYGRDVAAVVQRLPNRQIVLVGHLMGGPVALEAAPLIGHRLIGIIGVDTFTTLGLPPPQPQTLEKQIAPFRANYVGYMHRFVPLLFAKSTDPAIVRRVADDMSREPPQIAIPSLVALNTVDFGTLLPQIHVPITAIDSDVGPTANEARIRKVVPGFRVVTLKGAGEFLMLEDPQRFNPILLREIAALVAAAPAAPATPAAP